MSDKPHPLRLAIDNAKLAPATTDEADDGRRRGGDDDDPPPRLPEGCPVKPLGILDDKFFYLDAANQLRCVPAREHSRLGILGLFGAKNHLLETDEYWPARKLIEGEDGAEIWVTTGFKPDAAAKALMAAAAACGVWNPAERVRGRGAWLGDAGELILHCGDVVYDGGTWRDPGLIGRYVYPAGTPTLRPASGRFPAGKDNPAVWLQGALETWSWRRGKLDAHLLLGWICAAFLGGALDWRPMAWITGGSSTGKSTLHKLIGRLFDAGLVQAGDASAASLWQKLGHSTLPVNVDELESEEDNRRNNATIKVARLAASGAFVLRGGADHVASEFVVRSCFMFSSILTPPLLGQDRNRMVILELLDLVKGAPLPDLSIGTLRDVGAKMLRRLVDGWERLPRAMETYRATLAEHGHGARAIDLLGTLLACADIVLNDAETDGESAEALVLELNASRIVDTEDTASDQERCLQHLMTSTITVAGGVKRSIAEWIDRAASDDAEMDWRAANAVLGTYGVRVIRKGAKYAFDTTSAMLAIANNNSALAELFASTHWATRSGAMGVWVQALRRLPGARRSDPDNIRFGAATGKATLLPLGLVITEPDGLEPDQAEQRTRSFFDARYPS